MYGEGTVRPLFTLNFQGPFLTPLCGRAGCAHIMVIYGMIHLKYPKWSPPKSRLGLKMKTP